MVGGWLSQARRVGQPLRTTRNAIQRRDAEGAEEAQSSCHDDDVVDGDGKPGKRVACDERVILTRSRGDAEEEAEKHQESQSV
jgi:hypothetical protein